MSDTKHTPWNRDDFGRPDYLDGIMARYMVYGAEERRIPIAYVFDGEDARLIAAAPELLEALKYIATREGNTITGKFARAAIAKATGGA